MNLKQKRIGLIFLILIMFSLLVVNTQAITYSVDINQLPSANNVKAGAEVTFTAKINNPTGNVFADTVTVADVGIHINGRLQNVVCSNEGVPNTIDTYTWTIGPFEDEDLVLVNVYLRFESGDDCFIEDEHEFTVLAEDERATDEEDYIAYPNNKIYAVIGIASAIIVVAIIIKFKKK